MPMNDNRRLSPESLAAQAVHYIDSDTGAVVPPIHTATTFARDRDYQTISHYIYGRNESPTYAPAEALLARLDAGAEALLFASGLAAIAAVLETLPMGARIVAPMIMYHGTLARMHHLAATRGMVLALFDPDNPDGLQNAVAAGKTDLVWIETAVNPTWTVIDVAAAAKVAHAAGAFLAVDSTVTPPVTTQPLALGADIVMHSATKYLNGHSDVTAGVLVTAAADDRWATIKEIRKDTGGILGPFEAWLLLRGLRTLFIRFERASQSALALAQHFDGHPGVEAVLYPGLPNSHGYAIACKQMQGGFGGMLSILVKGGMAAAKSVTANLNVFIAATSLGGVESLVEHRKIIEGPDSLVPDNLLRLSIGIESVDDLIADLEQALARAADEG